MSTQERLQKAGKAIAKRYKTNQLFATKDNQFFLGESYARLHAGKDGKVYTLTYGGGESGTDGASETGDTAKAPSATSQASKSDTKEKAEGATTPKSDAPTGDAPTGDAPTGDAPTGDAPTGDAPTGDAPTGDAPDVAATLEKVNGVGAATAKKLVESGITSIKQLSEQVPGELSASTGIVEGTVENIIEEAKKSA